MNKKRNFNKSTKSSASKVKFINRLWKIVAIAILLIVVASVVVYRYYTRPGIVVCNANIINRTAPYINSTPTQNSIKAINKIQRLENFSKDVNCLYILVNHYINVSDAENSRLYYDKLEAVYNPLIGYSELFGKETKNPKTLEPIIKFLEKQSKLTEDNIQSSPK